MKIYVRHSQFYSKNHAERIQGVIDYLGELLKGLYRLEEIPDSVLKISYFKYFIDEINRHGLQNFFSECQFEQNINQNIREMLLEMGAEESYKTFTRAEQLLTALDPLILKYFLNAERQNEDPEIEKIEREFKQFDDALKKESPDLLKKLYDYVGNLEEVAVIPDEQFKNKMKSLIDKIEDFSDRKTDHAHFYLQKFIDILCKKFGQLLISIDAIDADEKEILSIHEQKSLILGQDEQQSKINDIIKRVHITTDAGSFYVVIDQQVTLVNSETGYIVGTLDLK